MTRSIRLALACALLVVATSTSALAQPTGDKKKALELYNQGNTQYNLGRWKQAIEFFTQAYEVYNAPEFLFNIAQAHRQDGNCPEALFFYRRYLANKPGATNKSEVDGFIKELEGKCTEASGGTTTTGTGTGTTTTGTGTAGAGSGTTSRTGTGTGRTGTGTGRTGTGTGRTGTGTSRTGTGTGTATTGTRTAGTGSGTTNTGPKTRTADTTTVTNEDDETEDDDTEGGLETEGGGRAHLFVANAAVGPSFLSAGDLETPVHMSFAVGGAYPLWFDKVGVEPGVLITYSPVPWEGTMEGVKGTAGLTALLANVGGTYPIVPSLPALTARADLGLGVLVMSGLKRGTPFLEDDQFADGAISMFHARFALGADYMVTPNIAVFAQPVVLSFSPASKLRDGISSLTRYEILFGAGYRM